MPSRRRFSGGNRASLHLGVRPGQSPISKWFGFGNISFIRVKPGMDQGLYELPRLQWKTNQEASKKEGLILSYKVLATEAHGNG